MEPLCTEQFFLTGLIGVIMHEVWHDIVFLFFLRQEAIMVLPVVLIHSNVKGLAFADHSLLAIPLLPLVLLVLEVHGVLVG